MNTFKRIIAKVATILPAIALFIGIVSANSACVTFYHQIETPDAMSKYRR